MRNVFNIFTREVQVDSPLLIKSGSELARVVLEDEAGALTLPPGHTVSLLLQAKDRFDADVVAGVTLSSADLHVGSGELRKYYSLSTAGILALLKSNANYTDDLPEYPLQAVLVYDNGTVELPSKTFDVTIQNSPYSGVIAFPDTAPDSSNPGFWTSITAGTSTSLNSVITVGGAWPLLNTIMTAIGGSFNVWQLQTNTGLVASDGVNFQRPLDYNAITNNVIWVRIL